MIKGILVDIGTHQKYRVSQTEDVESSSESEPTYIRENRISEKLKIWF